LLTGLIFNTAIKTFISPTFLPAVFVYDSEQKIFSKIDNYFDQYNDQYLNDYNKFITENNVTILFKNNISEEQIKKLTQFKKFINDYIVIQNNQIEQIRISFLQTIVPFIILPPIIILVIGVVIRWIIRGFVIF